MVNSRNLTPFEKNIILLLIGAVIQPNKVSFNIWKKNKVTFNTNYENSETFVVKRKVPLF